MELVKNPPKLPNGSNCYVLENVISLTALIIVSQQHTLHLVACWNFACTERNSQQSPSLLRHLSLVIKLLRTGEV